MKMEQDLFVFLSLLSYSWPTVGQPVEDLMMMESREAAPERSSFDAEQFNMAASYLKSQFSIPHHLVPHYEDVRPTSLMKRRLSTSNANIENHRFNPNISPYDSINEDIMYKKSRARTEYKKAKIYEMKKSESRKEANSFQQILNSRKEFQNEIKDEYSNMKVPRKKIIGNGRLSGPLPPERPSLLSAIFGFAGPKPHRGYPRGNMPPSGSRKHYINRRIDYVGRNSRLDRRRKQDAGPSSTLNKRKILITKNEESKRSLKRPKSSGELFDGLELDYWEDSTSLSTSPKPDYKRRWQNLTSDYIPKNQSQSSSRSDSLDSLSPVFSDWGDSMWAEIHQDWDDTDEETVSDMTARYLHAWADVSRIGTVPRLNMLSSKAPAENLIKPKTEINLKREERRKIPNRPRRQRPLRKRIN